MVMTLAVAALAAESPSRITDIECIKKTFPHFVAQMQALGCDMDTD
jgi:5-enolpyruvylshikimate-3-phosphate synthase